MKNLLIIGARGYGRECYDGLKDYPEYNKKFTVKGFLDDQSDALGNFSGYAPILSSVEDYQIQEDDVFLCALGSPQAKAKYTDIIKKKSGSFITLIHPTAIVSDSIELGEGVIISQFCTLTSNVKVGDFTTVQGYSNLGHDTQVGRFCAIESYTFLGGFAYIGDFVTLHTRSTVLPKIKIGNSAVVGAGSVVIKNVWENTIVFGNPAKKISF
jgi:sugar O-acyltransferase, sialic acid O-acetyltransferase NeuD family